MPSALVPRSSHRLLLALLVAVAALTCDKAEPTASVRQPVPSAPAIALVPGPTLAQSTASNPSVQGTIALPINQTFSGSVPAFKLTQTGTGATGQFIISNASSTANALVGNSAGSGAAVRGLMTGMGRAGVFEVTNPSGAGSALFAGTAGPGVALEATATGKGAAATFTKTSASSTGNLSAFQHAGIGTVAVFLNSNQQNTYPVIEAQSNGPGPALSLTGGIGGVPALEIATAGVSTGSAAHLINPNSANTSTMLFAENYGTGGVAHFTSFNTSQQDPTLFVHAAGGVPAVTVSAPVGQGMIVTSGGQGPTGIFASNGLGIGIEVSATGGQWAGDFSNVGFGGGVRVRTQGGPGLQVTGGTKNAVVPTSGGARALYTEESSEVWFTDYGFARLTNGRAHIAIDPTFAETVNLAESYHVFVQTYGDADLVVRNRMANGFDVEKRSGKERDAEFSYRLVAKRLGFEAERMKRAPWADSATEKLATRLREGRSLLARSR